MAEQESISIDVRDDAVLVTVAQTELDEDRGFDLEDKVSDAAAKSPTLPVILDLSQVELIGEDSLSALVGLLHECKARDQRFVLAGLRPQVLEILSVTKLGRSFEYRDDVEDALAHLEEIE